MPQPPFADVLRYLRRTCGALAARDRSDGELLKRFLADREDPAFTVLIQRHGRMVQSVCLCLLGDVHAAEDAFQATFMVLVRRGSLAPRAQAAWQPAARRGQAHRLAGQSTGGVAPRQRKAVQSHAVLLNPLTS